jgi:hypothetical protein
MIRISTSFIDCLDSLTKINRRPLVKGLRSIADAGFVVLNECFLLERATSVTNATINDFSDKTSYECFMNHIHVDEYADDDLENQSIEYASTVLNKWKEKNLSGELIAIIVVKRNNSPKAGEASVRFHLWRQNESWLPNDLDGTDEAVMEISSSDLTFFDLF